MSVRAMALVWKHFRRGGSEQLAMLALADWCDDAGRSLHPSIQAIALKIGASESQARRIVHGFIADGFLDVLENATGGRPGSTRRYHLRLDRLEALSPETGRTGDTRSTGQTGSTDARGRTDATGSTHARDGSHGCAQTAGTGDTQSVSRSIRNHQREGAQARAPARSLLPSGFPGAQELAQAVERHPALGEAGVAESADRFVKFFREKAVEANDWSSRWERWVGKDASRQAAEREREADELKRYAEQREAQDAKAAARPRIPGAPDDPRLESHPGLKAIRAELGLPPDDRDDIGPYLRRRIEAEVAVRLRAGSSPTTRPPHHPKQLATAGADERPFL